MKKLLRKFCLLTCILFFSIACSNTEKISDNEFLIEGTISGIEDGTVVLLFRYSGNVGTSFASDTIRNGSFIIKAETQDNLERLTISPRGDGFPSMSLGVWVTPGAKVKIKGKGKLHPTWEVKSSIPYQKEENRYTSGSRAIIAEVARISVDTRELRTKARAASSNDEAITYRKTADSLDVIGDSLNVKKYYNNMGIMEKTKISPIWLDKMKGIAMALKYSDIGAEYAKDLREKAERLYGRMSEEDKSTPVGYEITADLFPPHVVEIGDDMADSDFFDIDGNTKHLSDYLGRYLLLDFWSRGCGPCIMALPEMKEISETNGDELTIISISLDTDSTWKEALSTYDTPWINIRDPKGMGGLAANYGVTGIPNYVMISPEGKIIDKWMGYGEGSLKRRVSRHIQ
jgi:thiol-disulfide isomerase/thioredoxin